GVPASSFGCDGDHVDVVFDDDATQPVETECAGSPPAIAGVLQSTESLGAAFSGLPLAGTWSLTATDAFNQDPGTLVEWCLEPVTEQQPLFRVGGAVTGLLGSGLEIQLNGAAAMVVGADGPFQFLQELPEGAAWEVTVQVQPGQPSQQCTVANGSGTMPAADVTDVAISCETNHYSVGGTVAGLQGAGLQLLLNGADALEIGADGAFAFPQALQDGSEYEVSVGNQPLAPNQQCVVEGGTGTLDGADVDAVQVHCETLRYAVGGVLSGVARSEERRV